MQQIQSIVENTPWLMECLQAVRAIAPPDWYIGAGAIRNTVWDHLHGLPNQQLNDIDVVYFDAADPKADFDAVYTELLVTALPQYDWECKNQVRAHEMGRATPRVYSSAEAISYWIETPTCIGVRLEQDDSLTICAPHGIDDLMNLYVRPSPHLKRFDDYKKRMRKKQWNKRWPRLTIE